MPIPAFYRGGIVNNNMGWGSAYGYIEKYLAGSLDLVDTYSEDADGFRNQARKRTKLGVLDNAEKQRKFGIAGNKQNVLRLDRYLKNALRGRSGKYSKLSDEQLKVLAYVLLYDYDRLRTIRSTEEFLTLAMKWFYPSPTNKPRVSKGRR